MVDQEPKNLGHEEAIVPVKPGFKDPRPSVAAPEARKSRSSTPIVGVALVALVVAAVVVFFVLPNWVEDQGADEAVVEAVEPQAPEDSEEPALTPEELEVLRQEAESLLALLLTQQGDLEEQSAVEWGGEDFERHQSLSREGDDAFLANAFQDAVPAYAQALELGGALLERSADLITAALTAGEGALDAGNSAVALEQFELVLRIEAGNSRGQAGLLRAQQLPQVLALTQSGEELERSGDLEEAAGAYREALAIDGLWAPARSALALSLSL